MSIIDEIKAKARQNVKTIVLPEGEEPRTLKAAAQVTREGIAGLILLGEPEKILEAARAADAAEQIEGLKIIHPQTDSRYQAYVDLLVQLRKEKGMTVEKAQMLVADPMYYGVMMVKAGDADGLVSGAVHSTGDMLRPALQIIKTKPGVKVVSSSLLMEFADKSIGEHGVLVYADCVVNPCPGAEELAHIAISASETARTLCGFETPRAALLSFSTKGSAEHELVRKVREAAAIAHSLAPDLVLDGEMQFDAALVPEVGELKAKGSPVAGCANVMIFPDLQAGNIGYKITQRLTGATSIAVLQGLDKPCNDLSRGCSVDEIVTTIAVTAVQAGGQNV